MDENMSGIHTRGNSLCLRCWELSGSLMWGDLQVAPF